MDIVQEIDNFFGVYLLVNKNEDPKFCGRCYVGFTGNKQISVKNNNIRSLFILIIITYQWIQTEELCNTIEVTSLVVHNIHPELKVIDNFNNKCD